MINSTTEFFEYWTTNHVWGLKLPSREINRVISACKKAFPEETGGILFGFYNEALNCATITEIMIEIPDSKKGRNWFFRGIQGVQEKLLHLWSSQKIYYLGEWHFHPAGVPSPSQVDIDQMLEISSSTDIHCPEPILILFSGNTPLNTVDCVPYLFSKRQMYEFVEFHKD